MAEKFNPDQFVVPPGFPEILKELNREVLRAQPKDIIQFSANYFQKKLQDQRKQALHTVNQPTADKESNGAEKVTANQENTDTSASAPADEDEEEESEEEEFVPPPPVNHNRGRRTSVSAESMAPTLDENYEKVVIPKTEEQKKRIETAIRGNFLFRSLDDEQYMDVVNAMAEKLVKPGEEVIKQGGIGDYFYVVEEGAFDVFVSKNGNPPAKVTEYEGGGSFGELALMYNAPRAATVVATKDSIIWALDRVTFRRILMEITSRKLRMYESFLEEVPLLVSLEPYERHKIADALESVTYNDGDIIIKQGDSGDNFYIIESGEATVTQKDENGVEHEMPGLKKGDYFGELALLLDQPRKATIRAKGKLKLATLGKKAFVRLLGPVVDIIRRNAANYQQIYQKFNLE